MSLDAFPLSAQVGIMATYVLLLAICLVGNAVVVLIVLRSRPRTVMNYLLLNLAAADMITGLFLGPRFILHLFEHPTQQPGHLLCKCLTAGVLCWVGALASVYTLITIAFERYFSVLHPQSTWRVDKRRLVPLVVACWILAVCWNVPNFVFVEYNQEIGACSENFPSQSSREALSLANLFAYGAIPVLAMGFLYGRVVAALRERTRRGTVLIVACRKRITHVMLIISIVHCVCWLPKAVVPAITVFGQQQVHAAVHTATILLIALSSAVNPLVYAFRSRRFRTRLKELFACCELRHSRDDTGSDVMPRESNTDVYELSHGYSESGDWDEEEGDVL